MKNEICKPRIFHALDVRLHEGSLETTLLPLEFLHFTAPHLYSYITGLAMTWRRGTPDAPSWVLDALCQFVNVRVLRLRSGAKQVPAVLSVEMLPALFLPQVMALLANLSERAHWAALPEEMEPRGGWLGCASRPLAVRIHTKGNVLAVGDVDCATIKIPDDCAIPTSVRLQALRKLELVLGDVSETDSD